MTAVRMTEAQARRLGLTAKAQPVSGGTTNQQAAARRRRPSHYHTVCTNCGEAFTTQAAETRHLDATRHPHYQLVLCFAAAVTPTAYARDMTPEDPDVPDPDAPPDPDV